MGRTAGAIHVYTSNENMIEVVNNMINNVLRTQVDENTFTQAANALGFTITMNPAIASLLKMFNEQKANTTTAFHNGWHSTYSRELCRDDLESIAADIGVCTGCLVVYSKVFDGDDYTFGIISSEKPDAHVSINNQSASSIKDIALFIDTFNAIITIPAYKIRVLPRSYFDLEEELSKTLGFDIV